MGNSSLTIKVTGRGRGGGNPANATKENKVRTFENVTTGTLERVTNEAVIEMMINSEHYVEVTEEAAPEPKKAKAEAPKED